MKSAGKARNNGLYRHIRTSKEIIRNLLNDWENNSNIIIETVFVNDKGNIAVRMYETAGIKTVAKVKANINFISIKQTDMLFENPNDVDLEAMTFKPFEIKTLEAMI